MADYTTTLRPTADVLPADRLRNLIDRACRHLTPAEANALRGALAGTMRNATTAVEGLHQRAADAEDDRDRARRWAVHLENENRRLEDQQEALTKATAKLINDIGYARTTLSRDVLGWAGARDDMDLPQTVSYAVAEHRSELARARRAEKQLAALDTAGQPDCPGETNPPTCACPCQGCKHHCAAHQPDTSGEEPPQHLARGTNAEECPACRTADTPPPYPFICPGEPECAECGDTGACAGGPCAHPDAAPSR